MSASAPRQEPFSEVDHRFAELLSRLAPRDSDLFWLGAATRLLSRQVRRGHICLNLTRPQPLQDLPLWQGQTWPDREQWRDLLPASLAAPPGSDGSAPLVLDAGGRLYLRRYWEYEQRLAAGILQRCCGPLQPILPDKQAMAVEAAQFRRLLIISGGPGTGKTSTVLRILERKIAASGGEPLRILLAAPTGKAAARLSQSLRGRPTSPEVAAALPSEATTIHRMLGSIGDSGRFRHNASNPLPADLVVIDEASMVALPLMVRLFDALPGNASILLLGDRNQLSSVEPGAVLGDLARAASQPQSPLHGSMVTLTKNYRFGDDSPIYRLCEAVRTENTALALSLLESSQKHGVTGRSLPSPQELPGALRTIAVQNFAPLFGAADARDALQRFDQFRILCAPRRGTYGVERINGFILRSLREAGLLAPLPGGTDSAHVEPAKGMPILITANDYDLGLFNGDIGIFWPDEHGTLCACFVRPDASLQCIPQRLLPQHEPAFAMTVHKSQGSEFERVLMLLPEKDSELLTRELVYTGLTRARSAVELWADPSIFARAITRTTQRDSGLADALGVESISSL
jgi:exodeoxyribonuclease V alpha subunit